MRRLSSLAILGAFMAACTATGPANLSSYQLPGMVNVTFIALLPEGTPVGDPVVFAVVDDVTGLGLNDQHESMQYDRRKQRGYNHLRTHRNPAQIPIRASKFKRGRE